MTTLQQLGASDIDTKIAPLQFCERLCLVKTSPKTDFAFTPGRAGPDQTVSLNKLWPALKFSTYNELKDQLKMDNKRKARFAVAATKLARNAGIPMGKAGFAYLLGKGDHSANFLAILTKNDGGELVEDGVIFDFFDSMIEMEGAEGYCASSEFQQAFKIAMARMEIEEGMEESGEDVMPVQVTTVNSAKKTLVMEGQPTQGEEARKETPRRTSPRKKKQDVPVETVEFNGKEANASDTSSFGAFGAELAGEQDDDDEEKDIPSTPVADGLTNWAGMWNSMQEQGWAWMPGEGLVDWYYVHPNFANRSKSEVLKEGKLGEDYFVNEDSMMRYAKEYLGFKGRVKTPESNNNNGGQRRGRKRSAAVATTAEPIVETKKEKKRNSKAGKKQADKTQAGKKNANDTKGKKKTKILKSTYESESVDDGSRFSDGNFGSKSPTFSEVEIGMGVQSARKNLTYNSKQHNSTLQTAQENSNSGSDNTEIDYASNGAETESEVSEASSEDNTFQVMSSGDAWKLLMEHFGFKYHKGKYCLPGNENKPGKDSCAIEGRHYFSTLMELRKHLCAYGIPKCKKYLAYPDVTAINHWVRFANVKGLPDAAFVNPADVGGYLSFRGAWSMLQKLGLTWCGGFYIVDDPDPLKESKKFENQEDMSVHLARFGIPHIRGSANVGLTDDDRLRLDLYIASAKIDSL